MAETTLEERVSALEHRLTRVHSDINVMSAEVALAQLQKDNARHDVKRVQRAIEACNRELTAIADQLPTDETDAQERIRAVIERLDRVMRVG